MILLSMSSSDDQLISPFLWCFTSFSISQGTRVQLNGTYFYPLSFPLNSCHYFTYWRLLIVGNVITSTKRHTMSSLNIQFENECFEFPPQFFLHTSFPACVCTEVAYGQCVYSCCGVPPSTPLIVLHLSNGHIGHALTLSWLTPPPFLAPLLPPNCPCPCACLIPDGVDLRRSPLRPASLT